MPLRAQTLVVGQIGRHGYEAFFARRGQWAVLIERVLPVVRTWISLPAGIAKMPLLRFSVLTLLGSLPWTFALAFAGRPTGPAVALTEWTR
jgi:membrane protein DedA with SNARE-associated domain